MNNVYPSSAETKAPAPFGPVPSRHQLVWHDLEYYAFLHFTVNTYTDKEWGYGDEDPEIFHPTEFDADRMVKTLKDAGMKAVIITAKHHDGFCLWPSRYTEHSIKNSPYKHGNGDIVGELQQACETHGLKYGLYLSPWDRNHAEYGNEKYLAYYRSQLDELLSNYGHVFEYWFDGANGGDGFYGGKREERRIDRSVYYRWPEVHDLIFAKQPHAILFSDAGPGCRWVGNESGVGAETNWATMRLAGMYPGGSYGKRLTTGDRDGTHWVPAEVDVSIRPGWFYHADEDAQVKSLEHLLDIYYSSIGNGGNLLLNIPPDRRGRIHEVDRARLMELRKELDLTFNEDLARGANVVASSVRGHDPAYGAGNVVDGNDDTYWATDDEVRTGELILQLPESVPFNRVRVEEFIELGQRVEAFFVDAKVDGVWVEVGKGATIGPRRVMRTKGVVSDQVRLRITSSRACPLIRTFQLYQAPAKVTIDTD